MNYYEIWVSSQAFHGSEPLTYASELLFEIGDVVSVPLQRKRVIGFVVGKVGKPTFNTKSVEPLPEPARIPSQLVELFKWMQTYYPAPSGQIASLLLPSSLDQKARAKVGSENTQQKPKSLPPLTKAQTKALNAIRSSSSSVLLHGDTGSGKTRVYIELARDALHNDKSAIVLTPEISLTPQLVAEFTAQFPNQTLVMHSHLTPAERRKVWLLVAKATTPLIVIGPRSALFAPLKKVGLVVIDEAHDQAYKQEQPPHYLASRVAAMLANIHGAQLVLGSATPSVADYFTFESKQLPIVRMEGSAISNVEQPTDIAIVDIKNRDQFKESAWLSTDMIQAIRFALDRGLQSLVFLNRRGSARIVMCQNCGWQALCPRCDVPLTYHGDQHKLICHTCGHRASSPSSCPECTAIEISYKSIGTKAVSEELRRLFPEARVERFDSDNLKSERLDQNHNAVSSGEIDILVGTQILTKGLDLPKLAVVGIVAADTALSFPDYTAEETTFQQLSQVIGRVRRGHQSGKVIIQTFYPENMALKAAVDKNYSLFYKQQILEREKFLFTPFSYLLKLVCSRKSSASAEKVAQSLHTFLSTLPLSIEIIGPSPAFKPKQYDKYYWQIVVKAKKRDQLISIISQLPAQISYDIDPINLL